MKHFLIPALSIFTIVLTACSAVPTTPSPSVSVQDAPQPAPVSNIVPTPIDDPAIIPTLFPNVVRNKEMTRMDQQGAVIMEITPHNLGTPADTLDFDVVMNTHSVDLSMDLAKLATLTTDKGVAIQAVSWDAPRGGHHVSGKLIFPSTLNGKPIIEGASKLTLTIINVDASSRVFEWELN